LMAVYLYEPPVRTEIYRNFGNARGLATKHYVSTTTYRVAGVWYNTASPSGDATKNADLVYNRRHVVPDDVAAELAAFGIGTLTLL
jgi:hypothetical protein